MQRKKRFNYLINKRLVILTLKSKKENDKTYINLTIPNILDYIYNMKMLFYTTLIIVFWGSSVFGQEIKIASDKIDDFTGSRKISTKLILIGKTESTYSRLWSSINYGKTNDLEVYFIFLRTNADLGCLSEYTSYAMFKSGDKIFSLPQLSDTDCGSEFQSARFVIIEAKGKNELNKIYVTVEDLSIAKDEAITFFKNSMIEKIRLQGSEYYADYIIDDKFIFIKMLQAIQGALNDD